MRAQPTKCLPKRQLLQLRCVQVLQLRTPHISSRVRSPSAASPTVFQDGLSQTHTRYRSQLPVACLDLQKLSRARTRDALVRRKTFGTDRSESELTVYQTTGVRLFADG
jgi:hypothetical protein